MGNGSPRLGQGYRILPGTVILSVRPRSDGAAKDLNSNAQIFGTGADSV